MKTILFLFFAALVTSCEKQASEAEMNQARERIAELGGRVGQSIADLESSTEPGKVALATEDLREDREKLDHAIADVEKIIPRDEAEKIANLHQGRAQEDIRKWRTEVEAENKARQDAIDAREAGFKRQAEQRDRDAQLLKAMRDGQSKLETAQAGLEIALIDAGDKKKLKAVQAEHKKQQAAAKAKIDAQSKKAFPNGDPFAGQFILPED